MAVDYRDYYNDLGVARDASQAEIKRAYRKLARQHHPDLKPGDQAAERRFKEINEANEVLSDPDKRKRYDQLGANWDAYSAAGGPGQADPFGPGGPFAGFGGPTRDGGNVRYEFHTTDDGEFSDFFRTFFSGGRRRSRRGGQPEPVADHGWRGRRGVVRRHPGRDGPVGSRVGAGRVCHELVAQGRGTAAPERRSRGRADPRRGVPRHDPAGPDRRQAARGQGARAASRPAAGSG